MSVARPRRGTRKKEKKPSLGAYGIAMKLEAAQQRYHRSQVSTSSIKKQTPRHVSSPRNSTCCADRPDSSNTHSASRRSASGTSGTARAGTRSS
jgi:hypothetical protein